MPFKILFFVAGFALWIWTVIDIIQSEFKDSNMKLVWLLVVLLMPMLGTILYLSMSGKTKLEPVRAPEEKMQGPDSLDDEEEDSADEPL